MISALLVRAKADRRLRRDEYRVLIEFHERLDWFTFRPVKLGALASALQLHKSRVSRATHHLMAFGYIEEQPSVLPRQDRITHAFRLVNPPVVAPGATGDSR